MNVDTAAALDAVRAKLARGEDLKVEDLQSLNAFHHHQNEEPTVPYLDRSLLNNNHVATDRLPQLVRYVGMVQDMMDPEYYSCKDSKGRSTHFRDAIFVEDDDDADAEEKQHNNDLQDHHHDLAERTPLVVVPLPFASEWLQKGLRPESVSNNSAKASSPKSVAHAFDARKRARDDVEEEQDTLESSDDHNNKRERGEDDEAMDGTSGDAAMSTGATNTPASQPDDWWPAGTCGSSESECPVLAKFCYDQLHPENAEPKQRRLMLNDLVSMVGVLSVNPWEADFSKQQQGQGEEWMEGAGWGDDFAPSLPPPSLLPRLHVLSYERLDLEEMAQRAVQKTKTEQEKEETVEVIKGSNVGTDAPASCPEALLSLFDTQSNPKETKQLAEALWMCLLSKADRRSNGKADDEYLEILRAGPMERALGCLSLQLSMPDMDRSRALFQHLANNVLPALCPVVATVDFTKKQDIVQLGVGPGKDSNGRLQPCPLQLPAGSVLLVHYDPTTSGATASKAVQGAMLELVQHHRLPYRFEGDVVLPFEADYRVIVVTTQTNQLPCTLTVLSKDRIAASTTEVEEATYDNLREMLCSARSDNTSKGAKLDVKLSESLMERAQQDFMSRRRDAHEIKQQQQASGRSLSTTLPGEDDFHRWLTMTKLQAKSRYSTESGDAMEATVEDWEMALKVDDASQKAMAVA